MSAVQQILSSLGGVAAPGQAVLTTSQTWVCPAGVTSVSVVCVGTGGNCAGTSAGGGGALAYRNNIAVVPGSSYTVTISPTVSSAFGCGANAGYNATNSEPAGYTTVSGPTGTYTAGFSGGRGYQGAGIFYGSGGGAAGYSGNGGDASSTATGSGSVGSGGGGGGGSTGYAGGGVGLLGAGSSGAAGTNAVPQGGAGSGGVAMQYGGGGAPQSSTTSGAVRIIWPGNLRQFPSTRTANE